MFDFIKKAIQKRKFMRELDKISPVVIVVEKTITFEEEDKKKKVKKNAKRK